jgi:urease accessory protein
VVRDRATLRDFLHHAALPALRHSELPLVAHGWRALGGPDWGELGELCRLSSALKTAPETRAASEAIGRQRAELAATLRAAPLAQEHVRRAAEGRWPHSAAISAALEARIVGAPLPAALVGHAYGNLVSLVSAAMKLLRLGQNAAQSLLVETLANVPALAHAAAATPRDEIGWFNPWLDIAATRHETADARMFIS